MTDDPSAEASDDAEERDASLADPPTDLPAQWHAVVESRQHAEYVRDGSEVVVEVTPVRDGYRRESTGTEPTRYRVSLHRSYGGRGPRRPDAVEVAADVATAREAACRLMASFEERLSRLTSRPGPLQSRLDDALDRGALARASVALRTAVDRDGYSDDLLLDVLRSRFGDAVRAVVHRRADGETETVFRDAAHADRFVGDRLSDLFETLSRPIGGERSACTTATVGDERVVVVPYRSGATLVALDADAAVVSPHFTDDIRYVLAEKWEK